MGKGHGLRCHQTHIAAKLWRYHQQSIDSIINFDVIQQRFDLTRQRNWTIKWHNLPVSDDISQTWCEMALIRIHTFACNLWESNLSSRLKQNIYFVCVCVHLHLNAKTSINCLLFLLQYYTFAGSSSLICCTSFFVLSRGVDSMSSLCCVKMQSMKVFLPHPLKVKPNLSGASLSCSVKSMNQAHISWSHVVQVLTPVCVRSCT